MWQQSGLAFSQQSQQECKTEVLMNKIKALAKKNKKQEKPTANCRLLSGLGFDQIQEQT